MEFSRESLFVLTKGQKTKRIPAKDILLVYAAISEGYKFNRDETHESLPVFPISFQEIKDSHDNWIAANSMNKATNPESPKVAKDMLVKEAIQVLRNLATEEDALSKVQAFILGSKSKQVLEIAGKIVADLEDIS